MQTPNLEQGSVIIYLVTKITPAEELAKQRSVITPAIPLNRYNLSPWLYIAYGYTRIRKENIFNNCISVS
jgi:hypothetical protein